MADIATLGLELDGRRLRSDADRSTQSLNRMGKAGVSLRSAMIQLGISLSAGLIFRKIVQNTIEAQNAMAQLEARLISTGGAAGKTIQELDALAKSLQNTTTYSDEATKGAEALLLTFKAIRGQTFDEAVRATLDLATAMGTDLRSAALQVGKALEDPATQMSYLRRSGVSFTQEQIELAKQLQRVGDLAGAQAIVLKELNTQFGGSAEAARNTLGGALAYVSNQWNDLFEVSTAASAGIVSALNSIGDTIPKIGSTIGAFFGGIQLLAVDAAVGVGKLELAFAKLGESEGFGRVTRMSGLGKGRGLFDPLGLDLFSRAVGADLGKSVDEAEAHLKRLEDAAEEVRKSIVLGGAAGEDFNRVLTDLLEQMGGLGDEELTPWQEFLEILKEIHEEAKALERSGLKDLMTLGAGGVGGFQGIAPRAPTLGGGPVSAQLSIAEGKAAYDAYVAYVDGLRAALDESGPAWDAALRGVASLSDGLGLFERQTRVAIRAVSDIVSGLKDLKGDDTLGKVGGALSIAGAFGSVVQGILGMASEAEAAAAAFARAKTEFILSLREWQRAIETSLLSAEERAARELSDRMRGFAIEWTNAFWREFTNAQRRAITPLPGLDASAEEWIAWMEKVLALLPEGSAAWRAMNELLETARLAADGLTDSMEGAANAMDDAAQAASRMRDLLAQAFGIFGRSTEAGRIRRESQYEQMLGREGLTEGERQTLEYMREAERERWKRQDQLERDIDEVNANLDNQLGVLNIQEHWARGTVNWLRAQLDLMRDQLRTAEESLREQERSVEETKRVVEALHDFSERLAISGQSPLSPMDRYAEARRQYEATLQAARGGDIEAAGRLPGAATSYLEASRAVNASTTRYAADYAYVQQTVGAIETQFGGLLSVQERELAELEKQTEILRAQMRDTEEWLDAAEANLDAIRDAQDDARRNAQNQIDALNAAFEEADAIALEQLLQQIRIADNTGTTAAWLDAHPFDAQDFAAVLEPHFDDIADGLGSVVDEMQYGTTIQRHGFTSVVRELAAVRSAINAVNHSVRRLEEAPL